jgi:hypothetical protein
MPDVPTPDVPTPDVPTPDEKDWTWVLDRPCPQCAFDPSAITGRDVAVTVRATVPRWLAVLERPDATRRPSAGVWSAAEYACHVIDVFRIFDGRTRQMLTQDDPMFANWDQDQTAVEQRYWERRPDQIGPDLAAAGERAAQTYDGVTASQWSRPGRRSNGSVFTVDSLGRYFVHDVVHHLHDVAG